eukprot:TRINITY_DN2847_c0_g1_i1.p1 TRINITY_DN2847_c0_g1~~TRINITY_DN2847_c0_g1_i1.p1  ORF type:complete len:206 (-),score=43.16 TRINITY_DN2847_c0_g1_i1:87-677(-)
MGKVFGKKKPTPINQPGTYLKVNASERDNLEFKFVMVGDSNVGKSSLLLRYCDDTFTDSFISTIGVDYKKKNIEVDNTNVSLQLWDTAGQERFRTITSSYYRGAHALIIVFDVTNMDSFQNVDKWVKEVKRFTDESAVMLVGNKIDLKDSRVVTKEEAESMAAEQYLCSYYETSCATGEGVEEAFAALAREAKDSR